jgi:transcriptional regulator with GAF, ATPase, and Fis domain
MAPHIVRHLRDAGLDFTGLNVYLIDRESQRGRNYYIEPEPAGWAEVSFNDTMAPWVAHTEARLRQWRDPDSQLPMWYLTVPNVRGAVEICAFRETAFTSEVVSCLQTVAPLLTLLALRHGDLEQAALAKMAEAERSDDLEFLQRSAAHLGGHDLEDVARGLVQLIVERRVFDRAGVFLVDEQAGVLRGAWGVDQRGEIVPIPGTVLPLRAQNPAQLSQAARLVRGELEYFLTQDLDGEGGHSAEGNIAANLTVPLRLGRRVIGVLCVDNYFTSRPIRQGQVLPLMLLANQAALVIENSGLQLELKLARSGEQPEATELLPGRPSLRQTQGEEDLFGEIVAQSSGMRQVVQLARLATASDDTVLILGESGTGKDLLAHAIHAHSRRRAGPLVVVNSASLSSGLEDSELFGHLKGAFTHAIRENTGLVAAAHGGTLFLDEIGDLSPSSQAKLLRTLESGEVRRVGDTRVQRVDIRFIAATNRDLREALQAGSFRADLYYRLAVIAIQIPPLRERPEDIPPLAARFLARLTGEMGRTPAIAPEALDRLVRFPWPGNARQLDSCLRHAALLARGDTIREEFLPEELFGESRTGLPAPNPISLSDLERQHILQVLAQCGRDRQKAQHLLGISRATLQRRLKEYGITP